MDDPVRTRTWNPLIRSQMPYPLGHGAFTKKCIYNGPYLIVVNRGGLSRNQSVHGIWVTWYEWTNQEQAV